MVITAFLIEQIGLIVPSNNIKGLIIAVLNILTFITKLLVYGLGNKMTCYRKGHGLI